MPISRKCCSSLPETPAADLRERARVSLGNTVPAQLEILEPTRSRAVATPAAPTRTSVVDLNSVIKFGLAFPRGWTPAAIREAVTRDDGVDAGAAGCAENDAASLVAVCTVDVVVAGSGL